MRPLFLHFLTKYDTIPLAKQKERDTHEQIP